jgi:GTP cyclohydrolase I
MEYPINSLEWHIQQVLAGLGEDTQREGLRDTPKRYIKFLQEFIDPPKFELTTFDSEGTSEMIIQKDIPFYSLCEHHIAPFFGTATVAYLPNKKIVGLSKLARTVDMFARKFQNQERITKQVAEYLHVGLSARGVAVHIQAKHLCMCMRGVQKDASTHTSFYTGLFAQKGSERAEFLAITNK